MTLDDFFHQIRDAVRFYPAQAQNCLRPQTFRVLAYDADITNPAMGATVCDAEKPYFFSREWELNKRNPNKISAPLPVVTAFVLDGSMKDPFQQNATQRTTVTIAVWDRYHQEKCQSGKCNGCEGRTPNEIFRDTQTILRNVLYYLGGVVMASTNVDPTPRLYHAAMLEQMKTGGTITSYNKTGAMLNVLSAANQNIDIRPAERVADLLFGTYANISFINQDCASVSWSFSEIDQGILAQEAGCRNCQ